MIIQCPNCPTEMEENKDDIFCPKCGILFVKEWIIETAKKLTIAGEDVHKFAKDLCNTIENGEINV